MSVRGPGSAGSSRGDFEYDHPEVLDGGRPVSEGAESEAAAIAGEGTRSVGRRPAGLTGSPSFATYTVNNVSFPEPGLGEFGPTLVEGYFNRSLYGTVKMDPMSNEVLLSRREFAANSKAEPWRKLTSAEQKDFLVALERNCGAGGHAGSPNLDLAIRRLKDMLGSEAVASANASAPAAPTAARSGVKDLGYLGAPGKTLKGKTQTLKPGESLRFTTSENQIRALGKITVTPAGAVTVKQKILERPPPGMLGGMSKVEYTISVPKNATPGKTAKVKTTGAFQVRNDPDWAFSFNVKVGKRA